jgi:hypothetical protein
MRIPYHSSITKPLIAIVLGSKKSKNESYLIDDIMNKFCFGIGDAVAGRPVALALLSCQTVRPLAAALAAASIEAEVVYHVM